MVKRKKVKIMVVGPRHSGKSGLIATMHKAIIEDLTGYDDKFDFVPVEPPPRVRIFSSASPDKTPPSPEAVKAASRDARKKTRWRDLFSLFGSKRSQSDAAAAQGASRVAEEVAAEAKPAAEAQADGPQGHSDNRAADQPAQDNPATNRPEAEQELLDVMTAGAGTPEAGDEPGNARFDAPDAMSAETVSGDVIGDEVAELAADLDAPSDTNTGANHDSEVTEALASEASPAKVELAAVKSEIAKIIELTEADEEADADEVVLDEGNIVVSLPATAEAVNGHHADNANGHAGLMVPQATDLVVRSDGYVDHTARTPEATAAGLIEGDASDEDNGAALTTQLAANAFAVLTPGEPGENGADHARHEVNGLNGETRNGDDIVRTEHNGAENGIALNGAVAADVADTNETTAAPMNALDRALLLQKQAQQAGQLEPAVLPLPSPGIPLGDADQDAQASHWLEGVWLLRPDGRKEPLAADHETQTHEGEFPAHQEIIDIKSSDAVVDEAVALPDDDAGQEFPDHAPAAAGKAEDETAAQDDAATQDKTEDNPAARSESEPEPESGQETEQESEPESGPEPAASPLFAEWIDDPERVPDARKQRALWQLERRFMQFFRQMLGFGPAKAPMQPDAQGEADRESGAILDSAPDASITIGLTRIQQTAPGKRRSGRWFGRGKQAPDYTLEITEAGQNEIMANAIETLFGGHMDRQNGVDTAMALQKIEEELRKADHLVFCKPVDDREPQKWDLAFSDFCGRIARKHYGRFKTIVIAFTYYECLFLDGHEDALMDALMPGWALYHMRRAIMAHNAFKKGLQQLVSSKMMQVFCVPVSSYGFLPHDGRPNIDPWIGGDEVRRALLSAGERLQEQKQAQNQTQPAEIMPGFAANQLSLADGADEPVWRASLLRPDLVEAVSRSYAGETGEAAGPGWLPETAAAFGRIEAEYRAMWWPFLTADPFIACATGQPGNLMMPARELLEIIARKERQDEAERKKTGRRAAQPTVRHNRGLN